MAKFSVYVPDALWKRVESEMGEFSLSQLVQRALQEHVSGRSVAAGLIVRQPEPDLARIERIRARYAEEADAVYAGGYELGMLVAEGISADELIQLRDWDFALADYDLNPNSEPWKHSLPGVLPVVESAAEQRWGSGWRATLQPGSIAAHGAVAALRDVWSHLFREEEPMSAPHRSKSESKAKTKSNTPWEHLGVAGYLDPSVVAKLEASGYTVEQFWEVGIAGPWTPELVLAVVDAGGPEVVRDAIYSAVADAISPEELEKMLKVGLSAVQAAATDGPFDSAKALLDRLR